MSLNNDSLEYCLVTMQLADCQYSYQSVSAITLIN